MLTAGPTTPAASALVAARRDKVLFKPFELSQLLPMLLRIASG